MYKESKTLSTLILLLLFWLIPDYVEGQVSLAQVLDKYNFSSLTINDGLSHNYIQSIEKDSQGFLWLSTHNGLSRYDGHSFVNYNTNSSTLRLRTNFINQTCEDHFHRLWIASDSGIDILNLITNTLEQVNYDWFTSEDLSKEPVTFICKAKDGSIWLSTKSNLYGLIFNETGEVKRCVALKSKYERHATPITSLRTIDGEVWMGYGQSLYRVSVSDNHVILTDLLTDVSLEGQPRIQAFCKYQKAIWIGTTNGLFVYNPQAKSLHRYVHVPNNPKTLTQNTIQDIALTAKGELVVATLRGLNFYDKQNDSFIRMERKMNSSDRIINCNFINCLYSDGSIMWIGTEIGGLNKMERRDLKVRIFTNEEESFSLSDNPVNCIFEDSEHGLWVANVERGLSYMSGKGMGFVHYRGGETEMNTNTIYSICEDNHKQLWFATWGGGLSRCSLSSKGLFKSYNVQSHGISSDYIRSMCFDKLNNGLWLGTSRGLCFFDFRTERSVRVSLPTDGLGNNLMTVMLIDWKQRLWIGMEHGLLVVDLFSFARNRTSVKYHYMEYKLDDPGSRQVERICSLQETADGTIWLGSDGYGVYRLTSEEYPFTFQNYTTQNGLSDNSVLGILEDTDHRMWFSTNNGLSCYTIRSNTFANFYRRDGLLDDQFYYNAYLRASDGTLFFGSLGGMVGLEHVNFSKPKELHKVVFTRFTVQEKTVFQGKNDYLKDAISYAEEINLHERDKSFSIEFSAMDYENLGKLKYYYRLKGFDNRWIECDPRHCVANYTNLKSGHYQFQVYVQHPLVKEIGEISEIQLVVAPYFYKTWWFAMIVIFCILCMAFFWYEHKVAAYKEQQVKLTQMVHQRTLELEDKMHMLSKQNDLLTQQKRQLIELSKRIQEITTDKISFFTNITHEFRTPITLILGPIERALKLSYNPEVREQLGIMERNSKSLLSLVNQLLDFRKVESGKITLVKKRNNLPSFLYGVVVPFEAFAHDRGIELRLLLHCDSVFYQYDEDWMRKVFVNLLSNAIKFTPNGGRITVYVFSCKDEYGHPQLYMSVSDTGSGIQPQDLTRIFDRFYQARNQVKYPIYGQSGTGIGLYLCKRIINEHGGRIYACNNHRIGSSMRMLVPIEPSEDQTMPEVTETIPSSSVEDAETRLEDFSVSDDGKQNKVILVVDDNVDMRTYIRSILQHEYQVVEASDGEMALKLLHEQHVDFIVSDLMMPIMDGLELSRRVKEDLSISHIPFLMLTAKISAESRLESFRIGVDEYLQKPFEEEFLLVRIRNIFRSREDSQQQFAEQMSPVNLNIDEDSRDSKFLNRVMDVVEQNYVRSDFDVNRFAEAMGVSKTLLNQKLQNLIGQSTAKLIGNYRLKKAAELIEHNRISHNMNVSEIAYEVGFNDPKYFSRCYQKKYGILPSTALEGES